MKLSNQSHLVALVALVSACFGYLCISLNTGLHADEGFHGSQTWLFYDKQNVIAGNITMPPTYHYILAKIAQLVGFYSDNILRLINLIIGIMSIPFFYLAIKRWAPDIAATRTLQLLFFPMLYIYFFVIYTDTWSLFALSVAIYLTIIGRTHYSAIACIAALLLRQDNIAWVGILYLYICFEGINGFSRASAAKFIRNSLTKGFIYNLIFIGFLIFIYLNKGVAIGDAGAHQLSSFNPSNLHVFLLYSWILFLPLHIYQLPKIMALFKHPTAILWLMAGFVAYISTIDNTHPYNRIMYDYFVHNLAIHLIDDYPAIKVLSFFTATWTALSFMTMTLPDRRWIIFLLLAPIAAIIHPLIEPRYYIPAFFIILLIRPTLPKAYELASLLMYFAGSVGILYATTKSLIFL